MDTFNDPNDPNIWKPYSSPYYAPTNKWYKHPLYNATFDQQMQEICPGYQGLGWRLSNNWLKFLPQSNNLPLNYLEIGTLHGANLISVEHFFGKNKESKFVVIDPYADDIEYNEYKGEQDLNYNTFRTNVEMVNLIDDVSLFHLREKSSKAIPKLKDYYFDIIYVDGNHKPENVLEDAVMAWRKLKNQGIMIFDDYDWEFKTCNTKRGIDAFVLGYADQIQAQKEYGGQYFVQKLI
jgi:hypothetical protein